MRKEALHPAGVRAIGPYSPGVVAGSLLFTSGQIPIGPLGDLVQGDIRVATRQCLENIRAVLHSGGADLKNVIKVTVFLVDLEDFAAVNEVYSEFFQDPFPARTCVQVASLPKGARVEIEAVAAL